MITKNKIIERKNNRIKKHAKQIERVFHFNIHEDGAHTPGTDGYGTELISQCVHGQKHANKKHR